MTCITLFSLLHTIILWRLHLGSEPLKIIQHEVRISRLEQREIKPRYSIPSGELSLRVQILGRNLSNYNTGFLCAAPCNFITSKVDTQTYIEMRCQ